MEIIALVPARAGSKRVVGKNGRILGGKALLAWSVEIAVKGLGLKCWVSTDSREYGEIAGVYGAEVIERPGELAGDRVGDLEVIGHAIEVLKLEEGLLVYLRPTTPFRDPLIVQGAIWIMDHTVGIFNGCTSLRSVEEMGESAYKCFEIKRKVGGLLSPVSRVSCPPGKKDLTDLPNQAVPKTYKANGYIDIIRVEEVLLSNNSGLWGKRKYGFITPRVIEIDTEEDWEYAECYYERRVKDHDK